jgi:hypothetical protein
MLQFNFSPAHTLSLYCYPPRVYRSKKILSHSHVEAMLKNQKVSILSSRTCILIRFFSHTGVHCLYREVQVTATYAESCSGEIDEDFVFLVRKITRGPYLPWP